ncbi:N-6 DNA methylase [Streptomyces sp. NPDC091416]|uniref:N-6 DNA methylase n=1 Tax=Streptomyces sp. NPDC091416 TaxID=3366003 RepID=UPI003812F755
MAPSDISTRLAAALASARQPTPVALVPAASAQSDAAGCGDPGCARHAGTADCPPFPISRRRGSGFGDSVADAWYRSCGSSRMDVPAGVVAALALWPIKSPGALHAGQLSNYIAAQPPRVLVKGYAEVYAATWMLRPDLMDVAAPIFRWTEEDLDEQALRGVAAVTRAALRAGVLQYTGDKDPYYRSDIDLMSWTITSLRHHSSRCGLGEHHTPPEVADLMARLVYDGSPGTDGDGGREQAFGEPAAGTGGMFRSMVQAMRERSENPHKHKWVMQELDSIAAAGAAVNTIVWDLGPKAVVAVGDTLAEGDLSSKAFAHQRTMQAHRDRLRETAAFAKATADAFDMVEALVSARAA